MEPELVALAMGAATTVVNAMSTDAWQAVRARVARLLGRGDARAEQIALETLDDDAASLTAGVDSVEVRRDLSAAWSVRLRDVLRADAAAAGALRDLVADAAGRSGPVSATGYGVAAGGDVNVQAAQGGVAAVTIHGSASASFPPVPGTGRA